MPFSGSGLPPVAYREARRHIFPFTSELAQGAILQYQIASIPNGARVLYAAFAVEVAGVGVGATATGFIIHQDFTVILGATQMDLMTTGFYDTYTAAGSGGPTSVVTARKKVVAAGAPVSPIYWVYTISGADLTSPASGFLLLDIADEDCA